jgi:hypothetical protein
MRQHHPENRTVAKLVALTLACGVSTCGLAAPSLLSERSQPREEPKPRTEPSFVATGEVQERDERSLSIVPWGRRFPARVGVTISNETRFLRQRKGALSEIAAGDLVLAVELPPNARERKSLRIWQDLLKKARRKRVPERTARARALVRCWKPEHADIGVTERQAARALLTGALPFFRGPSRGGARAPDNDTPTAVGIVTSVEPFTIRTPSGVVHYTLVPELLVINHEPETWDEVQQGQTVLIHSGGNAAAGANVDASVVAISPRPKLDPERERRLIIRKRKKEMAGLGKQID